MPKTETVYARLILRTHSDRFELNEIEREIHPRLFEVLRDDYYQRQLTEQLIRVHKEELAAWLRYKDNPTAANRPTLDHRAVGKFQILDQKVDLVDILFY